MDIGFISERTFELKSSMILRIILIFSVTLGIRGKDETLIGCFSPQYLEIGTQGVIQCQFPTDFRAVYWFDNVTNENVEPTLSYKDSVKDGPGYSKGELDIFPNGSLIIKETEIQHEKTFKVICFGANELYNLFHISVITTVSPTQVSPQISKCDELRGLCFIHERENSVLNCRLNASRPASTVEWFVQLGEERELINSSKTINANPDSTFDTIARLNLSASGGSILAIFVCGSKQEHIGHWKYKPVLIEFLQNHSKVQDSITSVYFTLNEFTTLQCPLPSKSHIHRVVLWKRKFLSRVENIALWTKASPQTTESFDEDYSVGAEGSLVINSVELHHEGNFTCIASSLTTEIIRTFHLVVLVPPLPPYITISECPGTGECIVVSSGTGEITCTVSSVRPPLTFDWSTRDNSKIYFQKEETSTKEHAGLFSVSSTLFYKLSADIGCVGFAFVTCSAQGVSASSFPSVREVEILNVKCSGEPGETDDSKKKSLSVTAIILVAIISTLVVVIICALLVLFVLKQYHKPNVIMEDYTHLQPLDPNKDDRTGKQKLIAELKITYGELLVNWPATQWTSEYEELAKYVYIPNNLSMKVEQKISSKDDASSLKSYKDLFEREDLAERHILIEGGPGQGKTFFIMHLIKMWIEADNESPLKQFDIVITFSLKDMNEGKTFTQMIVDKLVALDSQLTDEEIKGILGEESRYLVLLDDFEQYPEKDKRESTVRNIMMKRIMRNTKVILMTRSTFATKTLGKGTAFLTLEDFTSSQIYEYFQKFVGEEEQFLGERLKTKFQENDNIALMCGTPLILFMFVCIFLKSQYEEEKLESVTTFFEKLLLPSTYSCYGGDSPAGDVKASFEHPHSIGISRAAIGGLQTSQFSWPKAAFSKVIDQSYLEAMKKFGVLKEIDKTPRVFQGNVEEQTYLTFSHDLYQYFYGAVYLAFHLPAEDLDNYLDALDAYTCQQLLVFTCGLSKKENVIDKIVKYLLTKKDRYPFPIRDCIIQCLTEVTCDDWNVRRELLEELCKKEYALSIRDEDSTTMKNAKAFLISICSKQSIPFNVLAFCRVVETMDGRSVVIDSGASLKLPQKVKLLSLKDFKGIVRDSHVMYLIENTENLTEICVYSSLLPSSCTQASLDIIKERKVTAFWITFDNQSVVTVSFPSICHGVWLRFSEVVIILYLRFCKKWNELSEEERTHREQDILAEIKEKGFKKFLKKSDVINMIERRPLVWCIEKCIKTVEVLINEWFWVYKASNEETAEEHSKKFKKAVTELQNQLKVLKNFIPDKSFPIEIFHQVDIKDIQYQQEDEMRPLSATLKLICQGIQL